MHGEEKVREEVSGFHIAADVSLDHPGMDVTIPDEMWGRFQEMSATKFGAWLVGAARNVDMRNTRKAKRGLTKSKPKPKFDPDRPQVSTARLLAAQGSAKEAEVTDLEALLLALRSQPSDFVLRDHGGEFRRGPRRG